MIKRFGFTLAEVLITLGIIGVVAAMTISSLINGTNTAQSKTGLKKIVASLNRAVTMSFALDNTDFSTLSATTTAPGDLSLYNMINSRMKVILATSSGTAGIGATSTNYTLFFNDGMAISFPITMAPSSCTPANVITNKDNCTILVDINGTKDPNTLTPEAGVPKILKDQFGVKIYNQVVRPSGAYTTIVYN